MEQNTEQNTEPKGNTRLKHNFTRVTKLAKARIANLRFKTDLDAFRAEFEIEDEKTNQYLEKFGKRLVTCCSHAIGATIPNDPHNRVGLKSVQVCNHRLCNVCNAIRAKKLRRKFFKFLTSETKDLVIKKHKDYKHFEHIETALKGKIKNNLVKIFEDNPLEQDFLEAKTLEGYNENVEEKIKFGSEFCFASGKDLTENFNFMHLTLTVPHEGGLWNGVPYFAREMLALFNKMRKCDWWQEMVFGGECCVETTGSEKNGLHVHIHALILVPKSIWQSRNKLSSLILSKWNELTIDKTKPYEKFCKIKHAEAYLKMHTALMATEDNEQFFKNLNKIDLRGSVMVGLKNLYVEVSVDVYAKLKKSKFTENGKFYKYVNTKNTRELTKGVLECLKYHFEPCVMKTEEGKLNVPLMMQLLPNIYRQRLYTKFGAFLGYKPINISDEALTPEDVANELSEFAQGESYNPTTGEPCHGNEQSFIVFDTCNLVFNAEKQTYSIAPSKIKKRYDVGISVGQAIDQFFYELHEGRREASIRRKIVEIGNLAGVG
jgi:hypothetical protein